MRDFKITFLELPTFEGVLPLASGYMEAMCLQDEAISARCTFEKISLAVKTPWEEILAELERSDADVYGFSCYVWNSATVRKLLDRLVASKPNAWFILGGPQVMHQAHKYLKPHQENVFVCNGEGERTFVNFLNTILSGDTDFSEVRGLSFFKDGSLITTEPEPRIRDLSEIPSPFLEGLFDDQQYPYVVIETNRGCPFKCNYCYWGGATGSKVNKYQQDRIERELEWISEAQAWYVYIADANWGMLKRDVELSKNIVDLREKHGAPISVHYCASKNTPERVSEISRIFHEGGVLASCSVALQTTSDSALRLVERENIKTSAYMKLQSALNKDGMSSFIELIWPLPGETLGSFKSGLAQLCELGADSFSAYNLLLMNNVGMDTKRDELGLVTLPDPDPASEASIVVQTNEVSRLEFDHGKRYFYAVSCLYTLRGMWSLSRYLNDSNLVSYEQLFESFVDFCWSQESHPWVSYCESIIQSFEAETFGNIGPIVHSVLHEDRALFDELLVDFFESQSFSTNAEARLLFEVDLLNRPYIYGNTPVEPKNYGFQLLQSVQVGERSYQARVPKQMLSHFQDYIRANEPIDAKGDFLIDHDKQQLPFTSRKSLDEHFVYCFEMSQRVRDLLPIWRSRAKQDSELSLAVS